MSAPSRESFTADVRHELALQAQPRSCCQLSELQGFAAAARVDADTGPLLSLRLTSNVAARKVVRLSRLLRGDAEEGHPGHFRRGATHVRPTYEVGIKRDDGTPLVELKPGSALPARACCRRAYLRGAFTAAGVVSISPGGSHLEFGFTTEHGSAAAATAITSLGLRPRARRRGRRWLVYVKGSEDIALLLKAMGASQGVLRFENDRILRELRGQANRQANSETANLRRSVATGLRQVTVVRRLDGSGALDEQPLALREMASVRLAMPSATLVVMADRIGVSKSAVNARLRRLQAVAEEAGLVDSSQP
jgi:DNA-binding transcriptional regulator WhiA